MRLTIYSESEGKARLNKKTGPKPKIYYHGTVSEAPTDELTEEAKKNGHKLNDIIYILDTNNSNDKIGSVALLTAGFVGVLAGH
ncbi:hypothetical protein CEP54_015101 [Fusarium duplospermum]|uniref:Uncharacterized protein n=1 Tax=Fusarium duplospermum TaxID=1325734 RepID=A0A428NRE8_9HYPO|nr:hypothetical protein CEP54_015101 [Fusarium duplospermum]